MKTLFILLVIIGVGVGILFLAPKEVAAPESEREQRTEVSVLENLQANPDTQIAELVAVDGSDSAGTGYRLFGNGRLQHAVVDEIPERHVIEGDFFVR